MPFWVTSSNVINYTIMKSINLQQVNDYNRIIHKSVSHNMLHKRHIYRYVLQKAETLTSLQPQNIHISISATVYGAHIC